MNKNIKRIVCLLVVFSCVFALVGCGEIKKAETTVNGMFNAFKNINFEEAQKYVDLDDINLSSENDLANNSKLIMETIFANLNYEIISSEKIDNNNVVVKTKITVTDMKPVLGDFFAKALEYAFSNAFAQPQPTEEETKKKMEEIFVECASKPELAMVTNEIDIKVSKNQNNKWKVLTDDVFVNALIGGFLDAAEDLENSFNAEE